MRNTVALPIRASTPQDEDGLVSWAKFDVRPLLAQMRFALNATQQVVADLQTDRTATPAIIWSQAMEQNTAWDLDAAFVAHSVYDGTAAGDGTTAAYRRVVRISRIGAVIPIILSTGTPVPDHEDVAGWDVDFAITGPTTSGAYTIEAQVTGDAVRRIDWVLRVNLQEAPRPK